jgi:error-prone DNA polymerase
MVKGLSQAAAERIVKAREERMFTDVPDLVARAGLDRGDVSALAAADALRHLAGNRYQAHWQAAGVERGGPLFERPRFNEASPMLGRPAPLEEVIGDYRSTGLSLKQHPMDLLRPRFAELGVHRAADLREARPGSMVQVAGLVVCRQRPDTASGVLFITLEDDTGSANLIVWPKIVERYRHALLHAALIVVSGRLQREEDVIHVVVRSARDHSGWLEGMTFKSRDFAQGFRTTG